MVLITGDTGFIGTNFKKYLKTNQIKFRILKRNEYKLENLKGISSVFHFAGIAHDTEGVYNYNDYYNANTKLTNDLYNLFLNSDADNFIFMSSIKAQLDYFNGVLTENIESNPQSFYGRSKYQSEKYIIENILEGKRYFILRPALIYGKPIKGNLLSLSKYIDFNLPWIFSSFENKRSFCSINNFLKVFKSILDKNHLQSGIYNVCDNKPIKINHLIDLISSAKNKKIIKLNLPKISIRLMGKIGDLFNIKYNTKFFNKLTENYVVSNEKLSKNFNLVLNSDLDKILIDIFQNKNDVKR